jgi:hypothetical protein
VGSLYRRGKIWWLQVYQAGEAMRKSTGTSEKAEARRLQRERGKARLLKARRYQSPSRRHGMRPALICGGTIKPMALEIFGKLAIAWRASIDTSRVLSWRTSMLRRSRGMSSSGRAWARRAELSISNWPHSKKP